MAKFRKKPKIVDATQWFKNGDHPNDDCDMFDYPDERGNVYQRPGEGKVVRYYRRPDDPGDRECEHCGKTMHVHGWIDTLEGGHIVCPGDWVITGIKGEYYPCKPDVFAETYELVDEDSLEKCCGNCVYLKKDGGELRCAPGGTLDTAPVESIEQLRVRALAKAIDALMGIPDEQDAGDRALALAEKLIACVRLMCGSAFCGACDSTGEPCQYHSKLSRGENVYRD